MTREDFNELLKEQICTVTFTKADGTERTIRGTLIPEALPEVEVWAVPDQKAIKPVNPEVVALYDIDADHWKSFRIDSLKTFETNDRMHYFATEEQLADPYLGELRELALKQPKEYSIHA